MKRSKAEIISRVHTIPEIKFENQQLTSFAGLVIFQALFGRLNLKGRIKRCFSHCKVVPIFGHAAIFFMLVVQLIMGYRRLRDRDYYYDDPMVKRVLGVRHIPDTATISRNLKLADKESVEKIRELNREMVLDRLAGEGLVRATLDFDGSVQSTRRHAEGTAVGFNKKKKGARSYYPLYCSVAQTGQFLDIHHRSGNVHDSNGAVEFMQERFQEVRHILPEAILESRVDSAFFSDDIITDMDELGVEFTASVPFERLAELKAMVENRKRWRSIDDTWSYFETGWKPKAWDDWYRFIFTRQRVAKQNKEPIQLDLFIPKDHDYDYRVIVTNKECSAKKTLRFHHGRGTQEGLFAEAKSCAQLDYIPTRNLCGNQLYTLAAIMAHNLNRELQMGAKPRNRGTGEKRPPLWSFESLGSIRHCLIQRAGKLTNPAGKLTLTMNLNSTVKEELMQYIGESLRKAS
ncbi:MAG: IS1380 family transposase [bacterium]